MFRKPIQKKQYKITSPHGQFTLTVQDNQLGEDKHGFPAIVKAVTAMQHILYRGFVRKEQMHPTDHVAPRLFHKISAEEMVPMWAGEPVYQAAAG